MRRSILVLGAVLVASTGLISGFRHESDYQWIRPGESAIVIAASPYNCALTADDLRRLEILGKEAHLSVRLTLVGSGVRDSAAVARVVQDLHVTIPFTVARTERPFSQWDGLISVPTVALVKSGSVVAVISHVKVSHAMDIIKALIGADD